MMFGSSHSSTAADLQRISGLQLYARNVVEGFCTGLHASPHKGFSVEFRQHRPYVPGDEIRRIDWKVFARSDRYYIREYEEETNLGCQLVLDASGSMGYRGTADGVKFDYARKLAACLAYLMTMQQDAVGLVTFDDRVRTFIPQRSRTSHLGVLVDAMEQAESGRETALDGSLMSLIPRLRRRGLVVLISDCFGDVEPLLGALGHLRHRGNEVIVFQIWDRDELEFPFSRWTRFVDLEDGDRERLVDPATLRRGYLDNLARYRERLERGCRGHRVDLVPLVTDEPHAEALGRYLAWRVRR